METSKKKVGLLGFECSQVKETHWNGGMWKMPSPPRIPAPFTKIERKKSTKQADCIPARAYFTTNKQHAPILKKKQHAQILKPLVI